MSARGWPQRLRAQLANRACRRAAACLATWLLGLCSMLATAAEGRAAGQADTVPLADALLALQQRGAPLVFSSEWVTAGQRVDARLAERFDAASLDAELARFGLALRRVGRVWVVVHPAPAAHALRGQVLDERGQPVAGATVRVDGTELLTDEHGRVDLPRVRDGARVQVDKAGFVAIDRPLDVVQAGHAAPVWVLRRQPAIEEVVVIASRYAFRNADVPSLEFLSAEDLASQPELGEDAVRGLSRLPGVASVGLSAKPRVRGGDDDEVLLLFDGVELLEPFHLKDFQSVFSSIDARAIDGVQAYTGAFPVRYGGRLSGVLAFDSLRAGTRRYEGSLSPFQAALLVSDRLDAVDAGPVHAVDGLLSLRRGNLDLLLDQVNPALGRPEFFDGFLRLGVDIGSEGRERIELGYLALGDEIELHNTDLGEDALSDYRSGYLWLRHRREWAAGVVSNTSLNFADLRNTRDGTVHAPGDVDGVLSDQRTSHRVALTQDWEVQLDADRLLSFGGSLQKLNTDYDFESEARYGVFGQALQGTDARRLSVHREPDGLRMGLYAAGRWRVPGFTDAHVELGLRGDRQTDLDGGSAAQLGWQAAWSARVAPGTSLRIAAGRYHQPPGVNSLRAADGVVRFAGVQRADQLVLGVEHELTPDVLLRVEAYGKRQVHLQPRGDNLFNDLVLLPELHFDRVRVDATRARAHGVEVGLRGSADTFDWHAFYALARSDEHVQGDWTPRAWDQRHSLGGALTTSRWGVDFAMDVAWHSGWPATTFDYADGVATVGARNAGRRRDYFSLDLRAERAFRWRGVDIDVALQVQNVTDRGNVGGERNVLVDSEREHAPEYLLPVTPSLTVRLALPDD